MAYHGIARVVSALTCASKKEAVLKDVKPFGGDSVGTMRRLLQCLECKDHREQRIINVCI